MGRADAPLVMVYSDFQCPYYARFVRDTWPAIQREYVQTGRLLIAFRHLPLPSHPAALPAAIAAECAERQGQFWAMHDRLFANQANLNLTTFLGYVGELGIDIEGWQACYGGHGERAVKEESEDGRRLGVNGTPVCFIGRRQGDGRVRVANVVDGARSFAAFSAALDAVRQ